MGIIIIIITYPMYALYIIIHVHVYNYIVEEMCRQNSDLPPSLPSTAVLVLW